MTINKSILIFLAVFIASAVGIYFYMKLDVRMRTEIQKSVGLATLIVLGVLSVILCNCCTCLTDDLDGSIATDDSIVEMA